VGQLHEVILDSPRCPAAYPPSAVAPLGAPRAPHFSTRLGPASLAPWTPPPGAPPPSPRAHTPRTYHSRSLPAYHHKPPNPALPFTFWQHLNILPSPAAIAARAGSQSRRSCDSKLVTTNLLCADGACL
jgi:hypothetical protein